ncbi:MAG: hypothetical protein ABSF44_08915 [Candidatus Bathyarchaeia archaeon]
MPNAKCLDCEEWGYYEWGKYKFNEDRDWTGCKLEKTPRTCPKNVKVEVKAL